MVTTRMRNIYSGGKLLGHELPYVSVHVLCAVHVSNARPCLRIDMGQTREQTSKEPLEKQGRTKGGVRSLELHETYIGVWPHSLGMPCPVCMYKCAYHMYVCIHMPVCIYIYYTLIKYKWEQKLSAKVCQPKMGHTFGPSRQTPSR
jgi:hypothetical protein